ncbi:putative glutathione peroxidase 8 isoform X2 [Leptodactylus fuscus]|uniref:putative glutathione peroxidase 8 isoform X2 n=1 Tax=Leptodactylus fuscus TaxID=238119 RepID=UPI003F4F2084
METLPPPYPLKCSSPKAKVFLVFFSMVVCTAALFILQLKFFRPRGKDFYSYAVKDSKGGTVWLNKYRGKIRRRKSHDGTFGNIWLTPRVKS